jgi:guanine deaminase
MRRIAGRVHPGSKHDMTKELRGRLLAGTFFHAPRLGSVEILEDALIALDDAGRIADVVARSDPAQAGLRKQAQARGRLERLPRGCYALPGFVDLHIHAPQYPQLGKALDCSLVEWLQRYTFPLEARFADLAFARAAYSVLIADLAANGTTTAVMYGTIHLITMPTAFSSISAVKKGCGRSSAR